MNDEQRSSLRQVVPFSTGLCAFSHPAMPAGMMNTFL
jgi:hypothetical protein